jgi:hypothetical protein
MGPQPLMHLDANPKISIIGNVIFASTGPVGLGQRAALQVAAAQQAGIFERLNLNDTRKNISKRVLEDFATSHVPSPKPQGLGFGGLLAAFVEGEPRLIEYGTTDFQPEEKLGKLFFASMGSGQILADPFLAFVCRVLWKEEMPTVDAGKFGVYWVLAHTINRAFGMVREPIHLATLRKVGAEWQASELEDSGETAQFVEAIEKHIGNFALTATIDEAKSEPLPQPPPPTPQAAS